MPLFGLRVAKLTIVTIATTQIIFCTYDDFLHGDHSFRIWLSMIPGQLSIDEAISIAQSVSSGNNRTLAFICLPQTYSSTKRDVVLKNRRLMEDKVGSFFGLHVVQLI